MSVGEDLLELLQQLGESGFPTAEVCVKRGSSKRFEIGPGGPIAGSSREEGWAVRAGNARSSFLACT